MNRKNTRSLTSDPCAPANKRAMVERHQVPESESGERARFNASPLTPPELKYPPPSEGPSSTSEVESSAASNQQRTVSPQAPNETQKEEKKNPKATVRASIDAADDEDGDEKWKVDTNGYENALDEVKINKNPQNAGSVRANASATSAPDPETWCEHCNQNKKPHSGAVSAGDCDYCSKWSCWACVSTDPQYWQRNKYPPQISPEDATTSLRQTPTHASKATTASSATS